MFCNKCGFKIPDESMFCPGCGVKLEIIEKIEISDPICSSCGEKLIPGNKFCTKCGKPVGESGTLPNSNKNDLSAQWDDPDIQNHLRQAEHERDHLNYAKAIDEYSIIVQKLPDVSEPYYWRGCIFLLLKQFSNAIADFSNAISKPVSIHNENEQYGDCYRERGIAHYGTGNKSLAITDFEKSYEFIPDDFTQDLIKGTTLGKDIVGEFIVGNAGLYHQKNINANKESKLIELPTVSLWWKSVDPNLDNAVTKTNLLVTTERLIFAYVEDGNNVDLWMGAITSVEQLKFGKIAGDRITITETYAGVVQFDDIKQEDADRVMRIIEEQAKKFGRASFKAFQASFFGKKPPTLLWSR